MRSLKILIAALVLGAVIGAFAACNGRSGDAPLSDSAARQSIDSLQKVADSARRAIELLDEQHRRQHADLDRRFRCEALAELPGSISILIASPAAYTHDDSCGLELIDQLAARFVRSRDTSALRALEAISRHADGAVAEYLSDAAVDIFEARPVEFAGLLHARTSDSLSHLESRLVSGLQAGRGSPAARRGIDSLFRSLEARRGLTDDQRASIGRLAAEVWEGD